MSGILIPAAVAVADALIKKHREDNDTVYDCLDGNIRIVTFHNRGAFLGRGSDRPVAVTALSLLLTVTTGVIFFATLTKSGLKWMKTGLGLLLGGAFSNTYDRLKKGYVTDYLIFAGAPEPIRNIVFNLSDFAIVTGALMSVLR